MNRDNSAASKANAGTFDVGNNRAGQLRRSAVALGHNPSAPYVTPKDAN
jgi:hypothetical protein